jgi:hypothetical protein
MNHAHTKKHGRSTYSAQVRKSRCASDLSYSQSVSPFCRGNFVYLAKCYCVCSILKYSWYDLLFLGPCNSTQAHYVTPLQCATLSAARV